MKKTENNEDNEEYRGSEKKHTLHGEVGGMKEGSEEKEVRGRKDKKTRRRKRMEEKKKK